MKVMSREMIAIASDGAELRRAGHVCQCNPGNQQRQKNFSARMSFPIQSDQQCRRHFADSRHRGGLIDTAPADWLKCMNRLTGRPALVLISHEIDSPGNSAWSA